MMPYFDRIELHAENGYLVNRFINSEANNRTDEYSGSIENRLRFLTEIVEAMTDQIMHGEFYRALANWVLSSLFYRLARCYPSAYCSLS